MRCSISGCKSDSEKKIVGLSFHSFPHRPEIQILWIEATGRINWTPKATSKICSKHFESTNLSKQTKKTYLTTNAIPTLWLKVENRVYEQAMPSTSSSFKIIEHKDSILFQLLNVENRVEEQPMQSPLSSTFKIIDHKDSTFHESISLGNLGRSTLGDNPMETANIKTENIATVTVQPSSYLASQTLHYDKSPQYLSETLKKKLKKARQLSETRLKKLKACREKTRRLIKKVANLETALSELKSKLPAAE